MRKSLLTVFAVIVAGTSVAQARPSTLSMTCGQAAATVASYGAAVLSTGPNTYDRFVANISFCLPGEYTKQATAPTLDTPYCPIGYTCEQRRFRRDNFY
jgi:hypothetical protein